ncbi:hypothetical protein CVT26_007329 [Gymnopilus dilepis]|uniref:Uncharacterized protein n=1 Tax=Gymnopilus dilepis TaxID=231916 RepID=A0A409W1G8_9AGAR|nr:hypothetical protein CVT26_007329 [Gymnopilus dilepis]
MSNLIVLYHGPAARPVNPLGLDELEATHSQWTDNVSTVNDGLKNPSGRSLSNTTNSTEIIDFQKVRYLNLKDSNPCVWEGCDTWIAWDDEAKNLSDHITEQHHQSEHHQSDANGKVFCGHPTCVKKEKKCESLYWLCRHINK